MEWGARALGNRSILADPRRARHARPDQHEDQVPREIPPVRSVDSRGGAATSTSWTPRPIRSCSRCIRFEPEKRAVLPAITHADGSGRLQTVSERTNPRYYRLIKEFAKITGVPVVLNTSFNENEPIVDTPEQALDCFLRTRMDVIVVNNTIIRRISTETPASSAS